VVSVGVAQRVADAAGRRVERRIGVGDDDLEAVGKAVAVRVEIERSGRPSLSVSRTFASDASPDAARGSMSASISAVAICEPSPGLRGSKRRPVM